MSKRIDARGQPCPVPVVLAKRELDGGAAAVVLLVDNRVAVENLTRLGENSGCTVSSTAGDGQFTVALTRVGAAPADASPAADLADWVVFVPRELLGDGDRELGQSLIRMYFYTLAQSERLPASVLFMNAGVKLPVLDEQLRTHLLALEARGVEILVCGACLNFYRLSALPVGRVSNMLEISERMHTAGKVITL